MLGAETFSTGHIALTAAIAGIAAAILAVVLLRRPSGTLESIAIGLLTAAAVFLLRKSANMPQLNDDGLQGFSANDWLAPAYALKRDRVACASWLGDLAWRYERSDGTSAQATAPQ